MTIIISIVIPVVLSTLALIISTFVSDYRLKSIAFNIIEESNDRLQNEVKEKRAENTKLKKEVELLKNGYDKQKEHIDFLRAYYSN